MGSKNACALEFACSIKCSVIIIINIIIISARIIFLNNIS